MNILTPYSKRFAGFSLVEMAIVILIAGIMMGAGLSLLAVKQAAAQADVTQKHQETIKQALINYLGKNKRLPCPAIIITTPTPHVTGAEDRSGTSPAPCAQYSGIVPYQELGLERAVALDGWENFIDYVVSPPPTTSWLMSYNVTASPPTVTNSVSSAFWPSNNAGSITANVNGATISPNIVASLISHGKNGLGAINIKGVQNLPLPTGTDELQNTKPISGPPINTVFKRDATDSTTGGGAFDDIVMILSANDLTGPLIANGTLQSNAQAALSQANDIVIGNIVASKLPCPDPNNSCTSPDNYYKVSKKSSSTPSFPFATPPNVAAWGVSYAALVVAGVPTDVYLSSTAVSPNTATTMYTLTAGDGSAKSVLIGELRGILGHAAGF